MLLFVFPAFAVINDVEMNILYKYFCVHVWENLED